MGFFWVFFLVPLQFSSTINLVLIASLVMTLRHPSQQPCMLASKNSIDGCLCASLMIKNVSLTQNVQKNMNDNPFSDYVTFSDWSVIVLGKNNMSSNMCSLILQAIITLHV